MHRLSPVAVACAVAVVDQLDGAVALVELPEGDLITVSAAALPVGSGEGARLCVARSRRPRRGEPALKFTRAPKAQPGETDD